MVKGRKNRQKGIVISMKENIDWQMLKSEYTEGTLTLTALAEKYNLSYYVLVRRAGMERWRLPQPGVHASGWQPPVPADRMEDSSQDPGGSGYRRALLPRSETHLCGQFHYGGG